jgi:hypothetical protein
VKAFRVYFGLLLAAILIFGVALSFSISVRAGDFSASLQPQSGLIQILPKGASDWQNVRTTHLVKAGDQVRTSGNGLARLTTVTGIEITIFPSSVVELKALSSSAASGQTFILAQYVGALYNNFKQKAGPNDRLEIALPAAGILVKGAQYYSVLTPSFDIGIFGENNEVEISTGDGKKYVGNKNNFARVHVNVDKGIPNFCSADFLAGNSESVLVAVLDSTNISVIRTYLQSTLKGRDTPSYREFLRQLMGLPVDKTDMVSLITGLNAFDPTKMGLDNLLVQYRGFIADVNLPELKDPIAPASCGNGKRDPGENIGTCPSDFISGSSCGNGVCELKFGEGAEGPDNCPADCLPKGGIPFAAACTSAVIGPLASPAAVDTPGRTIIPPIGTKTPTPSL